MQGHGSNTRYLCRQRNRLHPGLAWLCCRVVVFRRGGSTETKGGVGGVEHVGNTWEMSAAVRRMLPGEPRRSRSRLPARRGTRLSHAASERWGHGVGHWSSMEERIISP